VRAYGKHTSISEQPWNSTLAKAVLLYRGRSDGAFAKPAPSQAQLRRRFYLAPVQPVPQLFLLTLALARCQVKPGNRFPDNILARTPDMLVWWSPAATRGHVLRSVKREAPELNRSRCSASALVFKSWAGTYSGDCAVKFPSRRQHPMKNCPHIGTQTFRVCPGSHRVPDSLMSRQYHGGKTHSSVLSSHTGRSRYAYPATLKVKGCGGNLRCRASQFSVPDRCRRNPTRIRPPPQRH